MRKTIGIALLSISTQLVALEAPYPLTENSFDNPEFVERFIGSYGFDLSINPQITQPEAELFSAVAPSMERNRRSAISQIEAYISQNPQDEEGTPYSAALDYTLGSLYLQDGNISRATQYYLTAIRKFPNFYRAYQNLGLAYVQRSDFESGIEYLVKALEIGGGNGGLFGLIGYSYLSMGYPEIALDAYRNALMYQPDSRDWQFGKLNALVQSNQNEQVIAYINDMLKQRPNEANLWTQQANSFLLLSQYEDAIANLEVLRDMGQATTASLTLLGDLYLNEGMAELAVVAYQDAFKTGTMTLEKVLQLSQSLLARGSVDESGELLSTLSESDLSAASPDEQLDVLTLQARVALAQGNSDEAFAILEEVVDRDPLNGEAQLTLGDFYRERGDIVAAQFAYEAAVKVDEFEWKACIALARLFVSQREYANALEYLKQARSIDDQRFISDYISQLERVLGR